MTTPIIEAMNSQPCQNPFTAAAAQMLPGLLPAECERQLNGTPRLDPAPIEQVLIESLGEAEFSAYFSDSPARHYSHPLIPFDNDRDGWVGWFALGKKITSNKCVANDPVCWTDLINDAFKHKVGTKDGTWTIPAKLNNVVRANDAIEQFDAVMIDSDTGRPTYEIIGNIIKKGIAGLVVTSHSHLTRQTTIPEAKHQELSSQGLSPSEILAKLKHYQPAVLCDVTVGEATGEGKKSSRIFKHGPCPKHRILIPLAKSICRSGYPDFAAFEQAYIRYYDAIARYIGLPDYDQKCKKLAQPFFMPRHNKGADYVALEIPGRFLDPFGPEIEEILAAASKSTASQTGKTAQETQAATASGQAPCAGEHFNFYRWAKIFGSHYQIADALEARYPDALFREGEKASWRSIYCPTDAHEQNGGTHVCNASDGKAGFAIDCKHDTCAGAPIDNDRLKLLQTMVDAGWLSHDDLIAREYFWGSDAEYGAALYSFNHKTNWPPGYRERDGQIYRVGEEDEWPLCNAFDVIGQSVNENGSDWSILIEFIGATGTIRRRRIPMKDLHGNPGMIRQELVMEGLRIIADHNSKNGFDALLSQLASDNTLLTVTRAGFHNLGDTKVYVAPTGVAYGREGIRRDVELASARCVKDARAKGTLEGWKTALGLAIKHGCHHLVLGVCSGFAGPLLDLLEEATCGILFTGPSSKGKSTAQLMGTTVWTTPVPGRGLFSSLRSTTNAVENLAVLGSGSCLHLDELANLDPKDLNNLIFGLAGGVTKSRANRDGSARENTNWRTFVTLSSERTLPDLLKRVNQRALTGHVVRIPEVNVVGMPTLDKDVIKGIESYKQNYGHAGPAFIGQLFDAGYVDDPCKLHALVDRRIDDLVKEVKEGINAPTRRAAIPFAILWAAGDIAVSSGVLDDELAVEKAVKWGWESYHSGVQADALRPMERAFNALRTAIQSSWSVELLPLKELDFFELAGERPASANGAHYRAPLRAPFGWYDDDVIYILRDQLAERAGGTDTPQALAKALKEAGFLIVNGEKLHHSHLPKRGKADHYRLHRGQFLGLDQPESAGSTSGVNPLSE